MDSSQTLRNSPQISHKNLPHLETSHHHNNNNNKAMKQPYSHHSYYSSSRRTPSFSSSSSLSSSSTTSSNDIIVDNNYSPLTTPNSTPGRFSGGVPFSWEHFPGIPKKQLSEKKPNNNDQSATNKLLPLMPPPTTTTTTFLDHQEANITTNLARVKKSASFSTIMTNPNNKATTQQSFETDPFFAALVECSKDDHHQESRSFSNAKFWSVASAKVSRSLSDRFGFVGFYASCKRTCGVAESIRHLPRSSRGSYDLINDRSR